MWYFFTSIHWASPETFWSPPGEGRLTLWKPLAWKDSVAAMVAWDIQWPRREQTISTCRFFSVKFVQWRSAMWCVYIAKMGLGTRQRPRLPVSLCNFSPARWPNLLLLIRRDKKNINKKYHKSLQGSPAALTPPPTCNSNTTSQVEGRLEVFDWCPQSLVIS